MPEGAGAKTLVLVHGAWHAGWTWEAVGRRLRESGHTVFAPTAPGHGPGEDRSAVSHQDCADALVSFVEQRDLNGVVMVAHSWGGFPLCAAAPRLAPRLERLVFWNAFVPEPGETMSGLSAPEDAERYRRDAELSRDRSVPLSWEEWRGGLMPNGSEETARMVLQMLGTQAYSTFVEPLPVEDFHRLELPTSYVNGTEDLTLPFDETHWVARHAGRLESPRLIEVAIDHEALFTAPETLARTLERAAE